MKEQNKKFISLFLVFSLMTINCTITSSTKERRFTERKDGTHLEIWGKDDMYIEGELIAVKQNSLLLLNPEGKDESIDIEDIDVIRIVKKSKVGKGALYGLLILGLPAWLFGELVNYVDEPVPAIKWGVTCGAIGALIGGTIGAVASLDETIHLEGMTDSEIQEVLFKLRKKARIRDYK